jgi:hypothetical protein
MNSLFPNLRESEAAHWQRLDARWPHLRARLEGNEPAVTPLAPRTSTGWHVLLATSHAWPMVWLTLLLPLCNGSCSHHDAIIGASVEDFGSLAATLDGRHLPIPSVNGDDNDDHAADITFVPPPSQPISYANAVIGIPGGGRLLSTPISLSTFGLGGSKMTTPIIPILRTDGSDAVAEHHTVR